MLLWVRAMSNWATARLDLENEHAATAVEYAILVALIAGVLVGAVYFLGRETSHSLNCSTLPPRPANC